jgi:class 3 adenylate cyclase
MKMYNNSKRLLMIDSPQQYRESRLESNRITFERKIQIMRNGSDLKKSSEYMNPRQSTGTPAARGIYTHNTFARLYQAKRAKSIKVEKPQIELPNESKVSKAITDLTIKQVFGIVFLAAVAFPFLDSSAYASQSHSYNYGLLLLEDFRNSTLFPELWDSYISKHRNNGDLVEIISLTDAIRNETWAGSTSISDLRDDTILYISTDSLQATYSTQAETRILSFLDMGLILLMCFLMIISAIMVIHDYSTTIIFGLERMITFVKKISRDPMLLLNSENRSHLAPILTKRCCWGKEQSEYGNYEINLLEQAIEKIGVMLALGFGTAGCEIITQNIKASGRLNPLIPGKTVLATFGFFSIMNFEKLASLLQEDLLLYVNKISKLVHCVCEKYQGAVNRNLGESFLVVWKFQTDDGVRTGKRLSVNTYSQSVRQRSAFALISAVKTLCKLVRSAEMLEYQQDPRIASVLPFFTNKLTVGLHVGWGFEGPVGSGYKIDATYISPDVNIAARLETAAKQYGVNILASESLYIRLDDEIQKYMRHVDTVVLKGTENAMKIYAFDLHFAGLGVSKHAASKATIDAKRLKVKEAFEFNYFQVHLLFTQSQKIAQMREMYDEFFLEFYSRAIDSYTEGRWSEAADILRTRCLRQIPMDGPSRNLLAFMEGKGYQCPEGWEGARVLGSK